MEEIWDTYVAGDDDLWDFDIQNQTTDKKYYKPHNTSYTTYHHTNSTMHLDHKTPKRSGTTYIPKCTNTWNKTKPQRVTFSTPPPLFS